MMKRSFKMVDNNGVEKEYDVLFTFEGENGKNYIVYTDNTKDDNWWWFDYQKIRRGAMKLAIIGKMNKDGTPRHPGYFLDEAKNSLELFKRLGIWYKNNVEGYKG